MGDFPPGYSRQTHEFEIRATCQRARAGNSTICYRKLLNCVTLREQPSLGAVTRFGTKDRLTVEFQVMEQENGVVKFDIGRFVLCHRKLCLLMQPFRKGYETFTYVTRLVKSVLVPK